MNATLRPDTDTAAAAPPPKRCGLATASLWFGIAGIIGFAFLLTPLVALCCLNLALLGLFLLSPVYSITAAVTGHLALSRIRNANGALTGRCAALAGCIMGYAAVAVAVVTIFVVMLMRPPNERDRQRCSNHIRQLVLACKQYAQDYDGRFPPNFQALVDTRVLSDEKLLVCPSTRHKPGPMTYVDAWSDYVLMPYGKETDCTAGMPLVIDKPANHKGKYWNVAFGDTHAETIFTRDRYLQLTDSPGARRARTDKK